MQITNITEHDQIPALCAAVVLMLQAQGNMDVT